MLGFVVWAALSFQVRSHTFLIGLGIRFWERTTLCEGILALPALSSNVIPNFISHQDYEAATEKNPKVLYIMLQLSTLSLILLFFQT